MVKTYKKRLYKRRYKRYTRLGRSSTKLTDKVVNMAFTTSYPVSMTAGPLSSIVPKWGYLPGTLLLPDQLSPMVLLYESVGFQNLQGYQFATLSTTAKFANWDEIRISAIKCSYFPNPESPTGFLLEFYVNFLPDVIVNGLPINSWQFCTGDVMICTQSNITSRTYTKTWRTNKVRNYQTENGYPTLGSWTKMTGVSLGNYGGVISIMNPQNSTNYVATNRSPVASAAPTSNKVAGNMQFTIYTQMTRLV